MYKIRTTAKELRQSAPYLIECGYCDLQHLLYFMQPFAYTRGIYGWNFDAYMLPGGMVLETGYRGMNGRRAKLVREYDEAAEKIIYSRKPEGLTYSEHDEHKREALRNLLIEFETINGPFYKEPEHGAHPVLDFYFNMPKEA